MRLPIILCLIASLAGACARHQPAPVDDRAVQAPAGQAVLHDATDAGGEAAAGSGGVADPNDEPSIHALREAAIVKRPLSDDDVPAVRGLNTAVISLLNSANQQAARGEHERAAATLERAVNIEPGDAWLWHRLALARLNQGRAQQAEVLAAKSNSLAGANPRLQAENWRLIAAARRLSGDAEGVQSALATAQELQTL